MIAFVFLMTMMMMMVIATCVCTWESTLWIDICIYSRPPTLHTSPLQRDRAFIYSILSHPHIHFREVGLHKQRQYGKPIAFYVNIAWRTGANMLHISRWRKIYSIYEKCRSRWRMTYGEWCAVWWTPKLTQLIEYKSMLDARRHNRQPLSDMLVTPITPQFSHWIHTNRERISCVIDLWDVCVSVRIFSHKLRVGGGVCTENSYDEC